MISLLQLQYFLELASSQHLTHAAESLFISQSTLSTMISKLEQELGVSLFDRRNGRIYLNDYGREYEAFIKRAIQEIDAGAKSVQSMAERNQKKLSISVSREDLWREIILDFRHLYPDYYIEQCFGLQSAFSQLLRERSVDFVITGTESLSSDEFDSSLIMETDICLAMNHEHPWAKLESLCLKDIEGEPYIELSKNYPFRAFCDSLCAQKHISLNRIIECDYSLRQQMVCSGQGVALIVNDRISRQLYPGAAFVPISDEDAKRRVSLFWLREVPFTTPMRDFSRYITAYFSNKSKPAHQDMTK